MPRFIRAASPLLHTIVIGMFLLCLAIVGAGIWLVYLRSTGDTDFALFGQTFRSGNVGIAAIFIGVVATVLVVRRSLASLDTSARAESLDKPASPREWPNVRSARAFKSKIAALSENQFTLLEGIEQNEGVDIWELGERLADKLGDDLRPSIFYLRLERLERDRLIVVAGPKVWLSEDAKEYMRKEGTGSLRRLRAR